MVARTEAAATSFVLSHFEPVADRALDELLRQARREEWSQEDLRERISRHVAGGVQLGHGARGLIPVVAKPDEDVDDIFDSRRGMSHELGFSRLDVGGARYALLCAPQEAPLIFALPRKVDVGGRAVTRRDYVALTSPPGGPVLWWDGECMHALAHFEDLPPALRDTLDRHGVALAETPAPALGGAELRPQAVLEFPSVEAMAAASERVPAEAAARGPGLLFDSRGAVPLRSDLPVIRDPGELSYIMSRVVRGAVFLPTPARARDSPMEPGCPFAVLAVPGRRVAA